MNWGIFPTRLWGQTRKECSARVNDDTMLLAATLASHRDHTKFQNKQDTHTWSNPVHWGASQRLVGRLRDENDPGKLGPSDGLHFSDFRRGTLARGMTAAVIGRQSRCASLVYCVRYLTASGRPSTGCRLKRFKQGDRKKQRKAPSPWPDPLRGLSARAHHIQWALQYGRNFVWTHSILSSNAITLNIYVFLWGLWISVVNCD